MPSRFWSCHGVGAALAVCAVTACGDASRPTDVTASRAAQAAAVSAARSAQQTVKVNILDNCDGPSFNAAIGPGTCIRTGGIKNAQFLSLLAKHHTVESYRFSPAGFTVHVGQNIAAVNLGGEVHTFTRVADFGGGLVPPLNDLTGTPTPAPECLTLPDGEFLPPGATDVESVGAPGTAKFQCCIHPWMRAVVQVVP
jgi:plastocyanin